MSLTKQDIEKVALLSRLKLTADETEKMTQQLGQIVDYIEQLGELDTENVQPMAHAVEIHNVFADDIPQESLPREAALANAPKADDQCYRVPAVLGD